MRVLGLCLLAALGLGAAEGKIVTKCEFKEEVANEISHLSQRVQQKGLTLDNLLAKIICHVELMSGFNTSTVTQLAERRSKREAVSGGSTPSPAAWTLYGLFQLSNHLVCVDGQNPSPNICGIDCNKLIDDDTKDDIGCLLTILVQLIENGFNYVHFEELQKMLKIIFQEECMNQEATTYFAECP